MYNSELKPCPFCGEEAEIIFSHSSFPYIDKEGNTKHSGFFFSVQCRDVYCHCRIGNYETAIMAEEAWNTRVSNK
jgi:Lar family restriction alleviation protein